MLITKNNAYSVSIEYHLTHYDIVVQLYKD